MGVSPVNTALTRLLPGIQSGDYAAVAPTKAFPAGLWLVFGGRTNGLHNFTPSGVTNFPTDFQNQDIIVIDPANWKSWSVNWSGTGVPESVYNSLSSADQEFYQKGNTLYTAGGYSVPDTITFTGSTTRGSTSVQVADVTGMAIGQNVTGPGIPLFLPGTQNPAGVTITAIGGNSITLSAPATATASGVALTASTSDFTTYDTLSALNVSGLAKAVMNGGNVAAGQRIRQVSDPRFEVTGGDMATLGGRTYLVFGQDFQGGYIPFTASPPSFTQIYTNEIRSFQIVTRGNRLAITNFKALRDPIDFRRRDGNMGAVVVSGGRQGLTYYGGVFTPGDEGTNYRAPIAIGSNGRVRVEAGYQQFFDQYTTTSIPLVDARSGAMNTVFLGGISQFDYSNGQLINYSPSPGWVDRVSALVQKRNGSDEEYILPTLPGLYGAYSDFMVNPYLPAYTNGVIKVKRRGGPIVLGYMYGGIFSTVAQTSFNPVIAATQTGASNQVFVVTLTPTQG